MKLFLFIVFFMLSLGYISSAAYLPKSGEKDPYASKNKCLSVSNDLDLLEDRYNEIISKNDYDVGSLYCRGVVKIELGKYKEAIADFTKIIEKAPSQRAYIGRADAWRKIGETVKSDLDISNAFKITGSAKGYYLSAKFLQSIGRYRDAIVDYKKSISLDSERTVSLIDLAWLYATCENKPIRNGSEALNLAMKVINKTGEEITTPGQYATLAAAYAELSDFVNARIFMKKAIDKYKTIHHSNSQYYDTMMSNFKKNKAWREPSFPDR